VTRDKKQTRRTGDDDGDGCGMSNGTGRAGIELQTAHRLMP